MSVDESPHPSAEIAAFWKRWEGQTLDDRFLLGDCLGGGADHAVFATDYHVGQPQHAAVKVVLADAHAAEGLIARWAVASKLSHPHLLRILSYGSATCCNLDCAYFAMDYADVNLAQVLSDRALTAAETREVLDPVLDVLAYIHGQGFTHGRLRPSNILSVDDRLRLSSDSLCPAGQSCWSPRAPEAYDAPEIADGDISPAADIWALGVVLMEALTQRRMLTNESVPPPFREIVTRCLHTNPAERPTAAELANPAKQVAVRPVTPSARPRALRAGYVFWACSAVVFLLLLMANKLFFSHSNQAPAPVPAPVATSKPEPAPPPTPVHAVPTGRVLEKALPEIPSKARNTIHGTVRINVRVRVNREGRVSEARIEAPAPSRYLGNLTLEAARRWRFQRGTGQEWMLRFQLQRDETKVAAAPL